MRSPHRVRHATTCRPPKAQLVGLWNRLNDRLLQNSRDLQGSSPICGTGRSRICTNGANSTICPTMCCRNLSCGPATSDSGAGRTPGASISSSSSNVKYTVHAAWRRMRPDRRRAVHLVISSPALACFGPREALWCVLSARATATPRCPCRKSCPSRRCSLRKTAL